MKPDTEERCKLTIDLEDFLMENKRPEAECTMIRATITYNSGREEIISGKLNKDKSPHKSFSERLGKFKAFPTVSNVVTEKY